ncbi:MAG: sigma-54 dependent transcriptional regulator [Bdellovibrionia bacterium]
MKFKILVVDDDEVTRKLLQEVLEKDHYEIKLASSGEEAITFLKAEKFPIVLSDIRMLETDGMAVLRQVKASQAQCAVILMTGFGSMEGAIEAIQAGAFDYISKPFKMADLKTVVGRAVKHLDSLKNTRLPAVPFEETARSLIGKSPKIVEVYKTLARAGMSSSTVLVTGQSGTGKELVAHAIHDYSQRRAKRFVAVNCGALSENLLESELFGHVRGSFTGAISDKRGLFEEANGGTLFLDEIGDISLPLQIKLLRVLQEGEVKPVGATESKKVDVRIIAATHRDLENLVKTEKFREDLYYRLKVISIELPALKERMEDLPYLVDHFLARYAERNNKAVSHVSKEAMQLLQEYSWPGNIRELEHALERAVALTNTSVLFPEDFPLEVLRENNLQPDESPSGSVNTGHATSLEDMEKAHIAKVLQDVHFNKSKASEILGIDRATLYRKAQKLGIDLRGKS